MIFTSLSYWEIPIFAKNKKRKIMKTLGLEKKKLIFHLSEDILIAFEYSYFLLDIRLVFYFL